MTAIEATIDEKVSAPKTGETEKKSRNFIPVPKVFRKIGDAANEKLCSYNEMYVKKFTETGKAFAGNLKEDAEKLVGGIVEKGKKAAPKIPFANTIEKKVSGGLNAAANRLNIPSKDDVERLAIAVEALSKKVDELNVQGR